MILEKSCYTGESMVNYAVIENDMPPIVLLHGTANRWQVFQSIMPILSMRWKIYAPDFRGHGGSEHTENYGFGYYYDDTVRFLSRVVREPAVVFGHSLGGRIATKIAAEHPELVRAIILGDSSLKDPEPSDRMGKAFSGLVKLIEENRTQQKIYKALAESNHEEFDPVYAMHRAKNLSQLDPKLLKTIAKNGLNLESPGNHFYGYHPGEHLKKIKCPVLILQAEYGMLSDQEIKNAIEILPEAYHVRLMDVPHEFLYKPIEPLLMALNAFLETLRE